MKYTAKIQGVDSFEVQENEARVIKIDDLNYVVQMDGENHKAFLLEKDYDNKTFQFNINGRVVNITMEDDMDRLIDKMEFNKGNILAEKDLMSPMPGVILSVDVEVGQDVLEGDKLFTLEAMKMENVIKAAADGIIKSVDVELGKPVEKGQLLLSFE